MATQRYISTSLWTDEWFLEECNALQREGFIYLLTNPATSIAGVYQLSTRHMAADLTTTDRTVTVKEVKELFEFYEHHGKAYLRDGWVILPSWPRHQRLGERGKVRQGLISHMRGIPPWLKKLIIDGEIPYQFPLNEIWAEAAEKPIDEPSSIDSLSIDYGGSIDKRRYDSDSDSDSDTDTDTDTDTDAAPAAAPPPSGVSKIYESAREEWNRGGLPDWKYNSLSCPNVSEIIQTFDTYSAEEIRKAIRNYCQIWKSGDHELNPEYQTFLGFMRPGRGVDKYRDDADPFRRCKLNGRARASPERRLSPEEVKSVDW